MQKAFLVLISIVALALGALAYKILATSTPEGLEVSWEILNQLDYITGQSTAELKAFDGQKIKVPGFMVPLEDNAKLVAEFLLVPTPQACVHVPPPPSNQMVYVIMKNPTQAVYGPVWVYGKFKIASKKHMYGEASFEIEGEYVEAYR
jgi:uncharacterized protein